MLAAKLVSPFFMMAMKIVSGIVFLFTILSAFGGRVSPDFLVLPSLFCLAFPYFAILTIIITIFWVCCKKIIFSALGVLTIIICLAPLSVAFPLGASRNPSKGAETFKIVSWNVIHTRDIRQPDSKSKRAVEWMINSGADIIAMAELKNFTSEFSGLSDNLRDSLFESYPYRAGLNTTDIKIMSKYPVERLDRILNEKGECRYDFFKVSFPEGKTLIVGMVHLYSFGLSEEERQVVTEINSVSSAKTSLKEFKGPIRSKLGNAFRKRGRNATSLREIIDDIPADIPLIICGDFNDVPVSWAYNIVKGDDMHDAYAETNFGPAITYNLHAFYFHIDQMLYRGPLKALDLTVDKINTSDHYPLVGEFEFTK